jgi:phosphoribosyl-ATP pyrophosphohydrolase/phosphoribosyl-AMP cyclohydrolase
MKKRKSPMSDRTIRDGEDLEALSFWENGLLPVVAQDVESGDVLMVAFANLEALKKTLETGQMHYWSRSRQELWHKGATSGHFQNVVSIHTDCDQDTILARVRQVGAACHTGESTCFGELGEHTEAGAEGEAGNVHLPPPPERTLPELWATLQDRASRRPSSSYTVKLLENENLRLKKLGEETAELLLALARGQEDRIPGEAADLVYHLLVALQAAGVTLEDLLLELDARKS